jgi:hypothetical protein
MINTLLRRRNNVAVLIVYEETSGTDANVPKQNVISLEITETVRTPITSCLSSTYQKLAYLALDQLTKRESRVNLAMSQIARHSVPCPRNTYA